RARTLVVGRLQGLRSPETLEAFLDLSWCTAEQAPAALASRPVDLVLLDGSLPGAVLRPTLDALGTAHARPALPVVPLLGRRRPVDAALVDQADDVVNGSLGEDELLSRVRAALRVRGVLAELSRKNTELEGLYAQLEAMAGRMAAELRLASQVQRSFLPPPLPHPRLDVAREYIPVREIGGDYYDLIQLGQGKVGLAISRVIGEGAPGRVRGRELKGLPRRADGGRRGGAAGADGRGEPPLLGRHAEGAVREPVLRPPGPPPGRPRVRERRPRPSVHRPQRRRAR